MTIEKLLENFANSIGIIVDRTFDPPRILGQAFLVSKSKVVTCAGCVFQYSEMPWALSIQFPHPDLVFGIKAIALHPDFDTAEARANYANQTATSRFTYPIQFNDLATMVLQLELKDLQPEEIAQVHQTLTVPFSSNDVEVSGAIKDLQFIEVVKQIIDSKRQGLLTLFDDLNIPIAYIQLIPDGIEMVYFQGLVGEMALAELIYRKAAKGFAFQPNHSFPWGDLRKIELSAQNLVVESLRRAKELPTILNQLGGAKARYQKVVPDFSPESFDPNVQWLINNLWQVIDGYIMVDQLSEKVGADTYTVAQGLRELANTGVISLINRSSPFEASGQLGTPIVSHTDFDINPGDALRAFYLDPLTGAPCWQDGEFAGVASMLQPKNLLHSIPIYTKAPGALILKNYKLIGINNGAVQIKMGQGPGERQLFQMMWIGALFDMGAKKPKAGPDTGTKVDDKFGVRSSVTGVASLRDRVEPGKVTVEKLEKYICPVCYAKNSQLGKCFNCGAAIETQWVETSKQDFAFKSFFNSVEHWRAKMHLPDRKVIIVFCAFTVLVVLVILNLIVENRGEQQLAAQEAPTVEKNSEKAMRIAVDTVGFKDTPPPGYWFADTSELTNPLPSFGLYSDSGNQKVLFVVFNDLSPVRALDRFTQIPPFSDVVANTHSLPGVRKITDGSQIIRDGSLRYFVYNYATASNVTKLMLIGSFAAKEAGKGILVLGQALKDGPYDYKSTLFLIDEMSAPPLPSGIPKHLHVTGKKQNSELSTESENAEIPKDLQPADEQTTDEQTETKFASDEDISKYCQEFHDKLEKKILQSAIIQDELSKRKNGKLKVILDIDVNHKGQIRKIEIAEPDTQQRINEVFVRAASSSELYNQVPRTESGLLELRIVFRNGHLRVDRRWG